MTLEVPHVGEVVLLEIMLNKVAPSNVGLHLYVNDWTPGETDVLSNYTEATVAGYIPIYLTGASWTVATTNGVTSASYPTQTFTMTATASIYGYYVTTFDNMSLLWAERFAGAPVTLAVGGGVITVTPTISLD